MDTVNPNEEELAPQNKKSTIPPARRLKGVKQVIAVASGKGGVGKTTVSVNLALNLMRRGLKIGLLDADLYGPSVGTMLDCQEPMEVTADGRIKPHTLQGIQVVSFGFMMARDAPFISRGPVLAKSLNSLIFKSKWEDLDYLIIDLPPGTGDTQLTLLQDLAIDRAVIVTTPQPIALMDVRKGLSMFEKYGIPVAGVVENMAYHKCSNCGHPEQIFGDAIDQFLEDRNIPLLAQIPLMASVGFSYLKPAIEALDNQEIAAPFDDLTDRLLDEW